ncbi:Cloroperoxidase, partial [Pleurotus eryngii]
LPADHPPLPPHAHADNSKKCPFAAKHEFCPPQEGDVRSPCPALNTMANHGYINRSGKNLTAAALTSALQKCYNLSLPLAIVLSYGGFILLHRYNFLRGIDLMEVGKHGFVEHDASLVHRDTILGDDEQGEKKPVYYAPVEIVPEWVDALMEDARKLREDKDYAFELTGGAGRKGKDGKVEGIDALHAEIARGEMAIVLGMWEVEDYPAPIKGVPAEWFREWITYERLPGGWRPMRTQGLLDTMKRSREVKKGMERFR